MYRLTRMLCFASIAFAITAQAQTLLKNRSFELPLDPENWGCDQPASWIRWGSWLNRETSWTPTHGGKCLLGFHHWRLQGADNAGLYQDIRDAEPGQHYRFAIQAWPDKKTNVDRIELHMYSYHGGSMLTSRVYQVRKLKGDQWNELELIGSTPANGLRVAVIVEPKRSGMRKGALKLDDASLTLEHMPQ